MAASIASSIRVAMAASIPGHLIAGDRTLGQEPANEAHQRIAMPAPGGQLLGRFTFVPGPGEVRFGSCQLRPQGAVARIARRADLDEIRGEIAPHRSDHLRHQVEQPLHVRTVDGGAGDAESGRNVGEASGQKRGGLRGVEPSQLGRYAVVLANTDKRHLPQSGEVDALVKGALLHDAVTKEGDDDAGPAVLLVDQGRAHRHRDTAPDERSRPGHPQLGRDHMQCSALAVGVAADAAQLLCEHPSRIRAAGDQVTVAPVIGKEHVMLLRGAADRNRRGFLPDGDVKVARQDATPVQAQHAFLKAPDQEHSFESVLHGFECRQCLPFHSS